MLHLNIPSERECFDGKIIVDNLRISNETGEVIQLKDSQIIENNQYEELEEMYPIGVNQNKGNKSFKLKPIEAIWVKGVQSGRDYIFLQANFGFKFTGTYRLNLYDEAGILINYSRVYYNKYFKGDGIMKFTLMGKGIKMKKTHYCEVVMVQTQL